jgi:hypothetical protein
MSTDRIQAALETGTSIFVGTIGANMAPLCCRAIALRADERLTTATVYVPIATSRETLCNVATTRRIAVVVTKPVEHISVQLKGTSRTARLARDDEEAFVRSRLEGLADALDRIGVPRRVTRSFAHWPAFAIEIDVDQVFEQTPGPRAGTRLR